MENSSGITFSAYKGLIRDKTFRFKLPSCTALPFWQTFPSMCLCLTACFLFLSFRLCLAVPRICSAVSPCTEDLRSVRLKCVLLNSFDQVVMGVKYCYFLCQIKLVNINTTDVVDGRPSIVLGLIWTIILYFQARAHKENRFCWKCVVIFITWSLVVFLPQIEELTSTLPPQNVQTSSTSSVDSSNSTETTSPPVKRKPRLSFQGGAKKALLKWVQKTATKYEL